MHDTEKNGGQQLLSPRAPGRAAAGLRLKCTLLLYLKVLCWVLIAKTAHSSCWSSSKYDIRFRYWEFRYYSNYLKMLVNMFILSLWHVMTKMLFYGY